MRMRLANSLRIKTPELVNGDIADCIAQ
jgi:hypothetical protein